MLFWSTIKSECWPQLCSSHKVNARGVAPPWWAYPHISVRPAEAITKFEWRLLSPHLTSLIWHYQIFTCLIHWNTEWVDTTTRVIRSYRSPSTNSCRGRRAKHYTTLHTSGCRGRRVKDYTTLQTSGCRGRRAKHYTTLCTNSCRERRAKHYTTLQPVVAEGEQDTTERYKPVAVEEAVQ